MDLRALDVGAAARRPGAVAPRPIRDVAAKRSARALNPEQVLGEDADPGEPVGAGALGQEHAHREERRRAELQRAERFPERRRARRGCEAQRLAVAVDPDRADALREEPRAAVDAAQDAVDRGVRDDVEDEAADLRRFCSFAVVPLG